MKHAVILMGATRVDALVLLLKTRRVGSHAENVFQEFILRISFPVLSSAK